MNRSSLVIVPLIFAGTLALADDGTMKSVTPSDSQLIKTCMDKQKSSSNVTMSEAQLKRYCTDKVKQQKATGEMPEQPPADTPHDDTPHG
jgi:hypothetical protein